MCRLQHIPKQLLEAEDLRATQFVDLPAPGFLAEHRRHRLGYITDEHRLETGHAPADQRQRRRETRHGAKLVKEPVFRTEYDRGPQDCRPGEVLGCARLTLRFRLCIVGSALQICPDGRHLDEHFRTSRLRRPGTRLGAIDMTGIEGLGT